MASELVLDVHWNSGARRNRRSSQPLIQVHDAAADTVILRQSIAVSFEAPFLYLLFGADRALLLDTGATADAGRFPLREAVDELVSGWLERHPRQKYELVVAHTHAHGDHVAADVQFADRPRTTIVGHDAGSVAAFFGLGSWPDGSAAFELGERTLTILAVPGHHPSSIAIYDAETETLFTGDTVYPGRLYARDFAAFALSIGRLAAFATTHPVANILGAHIEMSTAPGRDYPLGSTWHPHEAALEMTAEQLLTIRDGVAASAKPGAHQFDDFAIWNGPSNGAVLRQLARLAWFRLFPR
jgi:hydroxyacylglutathione hydrolase